MGARAAAALLVAALAAACGGREAPGATVQIRDSAGVALVENGTGGAWAGPGWRVEEALVLSNDEARPETQFGYVADVAAGGDTLYVLDQYGQEVRVFGPGGALLYTVGGPGEGPGELSRFASSLLLRDDTLIVVDWGAGRLHRFRADGTFVDAVTLFGAGARSWWQVGGDGRIYARSLTRVTDEAGRWGGVDRLFRMAPDWTGGDTVLAFGYPETDIGARGAPRLPLLINAPSWDVLPDGRVVWTALSDVQIRIHGPDGRLERLVRREPWVPTATGADGRARLFDLIRQKMVMLGGSPDVVDHIEVDVPESLPANTAVRAGPDGTIWVQRMTGVDAAHPMALNSPDPPTGWGGADWDVMDGSGRYLGTISLSPGTRVTRILADRVVGVRRDALDRDEVVVWRLVR